MMPFMGIALVTHCDESQTGEAGFGCLAALLSRGFRPIGG
jgi:hypothetical protein